MFSSQRAPGSSLLPRVSNADRPFTQQGLASNRPPSSAGRMVQDRAYFVAILRNRSNEIAREIARLKTETGRLQSETATFAQLEKRHSQQIASIRGLEGELADLNLAFDKFRSQTTVAQVRNQMTVVKARNELLSQEIDQIFTQRKNAERKLRDISDLSAALDEQLHQKLRAGMSEKAQEISDLQTRHGSLTASLAELRRQGAQLRTATETAETRLKADPVRTKVETLVKMKNKLMEERPRLLREAERASLSPAEQRNVLAAQIKTDTDAVARIETDTADKRKAAETVRQRIAEIDKELSGSHAASEEHTKLEILLNKDREIEEFLATFDANKLKAVSDQQHAQANILQHLDVLARNFQHAEVAGELAEEASLAQLGDSVVLLRQEILKKRAELDKLETLNPSKEIEDLKLQMAAQKDEIANKFAHVDDFMYQQEQEVEQLINGRLAAEKTLHFALQEAARKQISLDALRKKADANADFKRVKDEQVKLQLLTEKLFQLKDELFRRTEEADYSVTKKQVLNLVSSLVRSN